MAEEELRIVATASTEDAEQKLRQLAGAKDDVTGAASDASEAVDGLAESTDKAAASEGDLIAVASRVNPVLGAGADIAFKSTKIVGDLAAANINLAAILGTVQAAAIKAQNALKLIGAGGGVLAGILAIIAAVRELREEAEATEAALRGINEAVNEQKAAGRDVTEQALATSAGRGQAGPASFEDIQAAVLSAGQIGRQFPGLRETAAAQAGQFAGAGLSFVDLTAAAQLGAAGQLTTTPGLSLAGIANEVQSQIRIAGPDVGAGLQSRRDFATSIAEDAARELRGGGATGSIEEFGRRLPGQAFQGIDLNVVAQVAQLLQSGATSGDARVRDILPGGGNLLGKALAVPLAGPLEQGGAQFLELEKLVEVAKAAGIDATTSDIRAAQLLRQQIGRQSGAITINSQNSRHFNNGAAARRESTKTGERRRNSTSTNKGRR